MANLSTNECYAYFAIVGDDVDPDEVTRALGVAPTEVKRKGSRIPGRVPRFNMWIYGSEHYSGEIVDVAEISNELVKQLLPKASVIKSLKAEYNAELYLEVVLHISCNESISTPAIGFTSPTIEFLSEVGAYIDVDTYRNT